MGNTILSEKLLRESIDYYNELKSLNCVVKNSMPIVFFGNIDSYIITNIYLIYTFRELIISKFHKVSISINEYLL